MVQATGKLREVFSDYALLIELEPEELAGYILAYAHQATFSERQALLRRGLPGLVSLGEVPAQIRDQVTLALAEAWQWLDREGLIAPQPHSRGFTITRRGQRLKSEADVAAYVASRALPRTLVHPRLVQRVWSTVVRGDYETAVFQSFREVEIAVRDASQLPSTELGISLMRRAFDKNSGPLSDLNEPEGEREALAHLFAGAIGRFKNPSSHRPVEYGLTDAAEALMLASLLLRVVDERRESLERQLIRAAPDGHR